MGKVRTRVLGNEEEEKKQKAEQKKKSIEKKSKTKVEETEVVAEAPQKDEEAPKKTVKAKASKTTAPKERPHGKKYKQAKKQVEAGKSYRVDEAVTLLKKLAFASFDESVEVHLNVNEEGLKGEVELPHATGKTTRVAVVSDELLATIEKGVIDFDILVTHPSFMPKLARFAKVLGPRGLMPNPKAGTISDKPEELVKKFTKGALRWKTEAKFPLIHQMIGKVSFENKALEENVTLFLRSVGKARIVQATLKTTMSPGVKLDIDKV